jgi:hypothetical protein
MMQATALNVTTADACPYCGQPVTKHQLQAIRERVRQEEHGDSLLVLEPRLGQLPVFA